MFWLFFMSLLSGCSFVAGITATGPASVEGLQVKSSGIVISGENLKSVTSAEIPELNTKLSPQVVEGILKLKPLSPVTLVAGMTYSLIVRDAEAQTTFTIEVTGGVPSGAVMAFDLPACPRGGVFIIRPRAV